MHELFLFIVPKIATIIEFIGLIVIIIAVVQSVAKMIFEEKFNFLLSEKDLTLNSGLSTALEIFLAAEILKTTVAHSINDLISVGALVIIRIFIALIIHWEMSQKERHLEIEEKKEELSNK